jgi:hypothetical protein
MAAQFTADLMPKNTGTSLGDLLKLQAYSAQADIAQVEAAKAKQVGIEREVYQGFMKDPKNWSTPDGDIDIDKVNSVIPVIMPLTGAEYAGKLNALHKNNTEARDAKLNFDQKERSVVGSVYSALGYAGVQDKNTYAKALNNLKDQFPNSKNIHRYADAAIGNLSMANDGASLPKIALQTANQLLSPADQYQQFAPKASIQNIAGADRPVVTRPSVAGSTPSIEPTNFAGPGGVVSQPTGAMAPKVESKMPKLIQEDESLSFTPNSAGIRNLDKYQEAAYSEGDKKVLNANTTLVAQKDLQQAVRKVEDYMGSASGSKAYQMIQQGGKWIFPNADLDALVKNLSQVQARNAAVMGLDKTDSSRELNAKLSGSEKIAPDALAGVMQQVKAESTAAELYTAGLNKFVEKRGDINGKIQAQKFQNAWADHYDSRIFQIDNIAQSKMPENEKQAKIDQITGNMSESDFKKYKKNSVIIHRLAKGLYQ